MSDDDFSEKMARLNSMMEVSSLLPDRCYLILSQTDDENVSMSVYDTMDFDSDSDDISPAQVLIQGLLEIMESDIEQVLEAGMARISLLDMEQKTSTIGSQHIGDNIIKVDFGKKH